MTHTVEASITSAPCEKSPEQLAEEWAHDLPRLYQLVADVEALVVKRWVDQGASDEEVARKLSERDHPLRNEGLKRWLREYQRTTTARASPEGLPAL